MENYNPNDKQIYIETPLVFSKYLSDIVDNPVFLKLENTQPSASFKLRGVSTLCKQKIKDGCKKLVGSSGGNAGVALAYSAYHLNVPCQLFVPTYTSKDTLEKIKAFGTEVAVHGFDWKLANAEAVKLAESDPSIGFVHPYDHPEIWKGNSTIIDELKVQLQGRKPGCIVTSVGGGGLLIGLLEGLEKNGWSQVPVLAMETEGAECFHKSIKAGELVEINLTSVAKSLGARSVASKLMEIYKNFNVISHVLPDKYAVKGCKLFADQHGYLVEPACGVTLASVYEKLVPEILREYGLHTDEPIILVVCGGCDVTTSKLQELVEQFDLCNGNSD